MRQASRYFAPSKADWQFAALKVKWKYFRLALALKAYDPSQPRVPAGNPDGGQWTSTGASSAGATAKPVRVAQSGGGRPSIAPVSIGGQIFNANPAQLSRYSAATTRADFYSRQVRNIDPNWKPPHSISETIEGHIRQREAEAEAAIRHLNKILPGGFGSYENYARYGNSCIQGLRETRVEDAELYIRGSSVTGVRYKDGTPFGRGSDHDLAIVSPTLMRRALEIGVQSQNNGRRTKALNEDQVRDLGLLPLQNRLHKQTGYPPSFMIY